MKMSKNKRIFIMSFCANIMFSKENESILYVNNNTDFGFESVKWVQNRKFIYAYVYVFFVVPLPVQSMSEHLSQCPAKKKK